MDGYFYNPAGGLDTASDLQFITQQLTKQLEVLQKSVADFMRMNDGDAPANYNQLQNEWNQGQIAMNAGLGKGIQALDEIHNEILRGDIQGAGEFSR